MSGYFGIQYYKNATKSGIRAVKGDQGVGFKLDDEGNYDMQNKRLTNIQEAKDGTDAVVLNSALSYYNKAIRFSEDNWKRIASVQLEIEATKSQVRDASYSIEKGNRDLEDKLIKQKHLLDKSLHVISEIHSSIATVTGDIENLQRAHFVGYASLFRVSSKPTNFKLERLRESQFMVYIQRDVNYIKCQHAGLYKISLVLRTSGNNKISFRLTNGADVHEFDMQRLSGTERSVIEHTLFLTSFLNNEHTLMMNTEDQKTETIRDFYIEIKYISDAF